MTDEELIEELSEMGRHPCRAHLPMGETLRQAADRIETLTAENERLRKALEEAPIIGLRESGEEFKPRQDNWLKTKAFPALPEAER
jgi:hypothetical protein